MDKFIEFFYQHIDTLITVSVTVFGFIVTYFMTQKTFQNEVRKDKIARTMESIQDLPIEICELIDLSLRKTQNENIEENIKK